MGLFSVLRVGTRGLAASQLGMDITGQNISNADVEGYSRKRLNMTADYRYDGLLGQMGFGVDVINIERMRNIYIDQQIQRQKQDLGIYQEIDHTLEAIENVFTEPGDTGIMAFIDRFFDSWENLSNNPSDIAARTMVKTNAEIITDVFHNVSGELRDLRQTRNEEIQNRIEKVNKIAREIYNLNSEIGSVEIGSQNANDSRDKRDQLVKELSAIVKIDTIENEIGQITVTTGGSILVSPVDVNELETTSTTYSRTDGTTYSDIGLRFKNSKKQYTPTGGQLKGLYSSRDTIIPEYESKLDTLALALVEKINEQHVRGYNLMGYTGFNFFNTQTTGASDIALSDSIVSDVKNIAAALGGEEKTGGTNTVTAGTLNFGQPPVALAKAGGTIPPLPSANAIAHNIVHGSTVVTVSGTVLTEGADYHIDHVNGTIQMLHAGYDGNTVVIDFKYKTDNFPGPGNNANAIAIAQLRHALTMESDSLGNPTATFDQYYSTLIGRLGLQRNEANSNLETREFLVEQYQAHQDAIAGVSLDEEMAELIKFQHTYQASARVITTASEMLDVLMNM